MLQLLFPSFFKAKSNELSVAHRQLLTVVAFKGWLALGGVLWYVSGLSLSEVLQKPIKYETTTMHSPNEDALAFVNSISYFVTAGLVVMYLIMVFFHKQLDFSKNPTMYDSVLPLLMQSYNVFQVIFNAIWCTLVVIVLITRRQSIFNSPGYWDPSFGQLIWLHYVNKFIEFTDTFFMIARGKAAQQMSFLHVSHHAMMCFAWLSVLKVFPSGDVWLGAWINSLVHVLMYTYYFASQYGRGNPESVLGKLAARFKKTLTSIQLTQFAICLLHAIGCAVIGSVPVSICAVQLGVMLWMLWLFADFFKKSYLSSDKKSK